MTTPNEQPAAVAPLMSHLIELRSRLLKSVAVILAIFLVLAYFANPLFEYLSEPLLRYLPEGTQMLATEVISPFTTPFKLAFYAALFLSVPFILGQVWGFVAPGLYKSERRILLPLLVCAVFLFYLGIAFAYYLVFPVMFGFMTGIVPMGVTYAPDIARYLDIVLGMFVAFGAAFEIPIATILLVLLGVTNTQSLKQKRPWVVVFCFVIGAVLTPPDVLSQIMLAVPMWLLFEIGVFFAQLLEKSRAK